MEMVQQLLPDRFQLRFHQVTKEVDGYSLVIAEGGVKMKEAQPGVRPGGWSSRPGSLMGGGDTAVIGFTIQQALRVPVRDDTGLTGTYEIHLRFRPEPSAGTARNIWFGTSRPELHDHDTDSTDAPSIFTAVQEQLGLRLDPAKIKVEYLVIDSAVHKLISSSEMKSTEFDKLI